MVPLDEHNLWTLRRTTKLETDQGIQYQGSFMRKMPWTDEGGYGKHAFAVDGEKVVSMRYMP